MSITLPLDQHCRHGLPPRYCAVCAIALDPPRRASEILAELDQHATAILVTSHFVSAVTREKIELLRHEIAASLSRPAESERLVDDTAAMLATACWHLCFERSRGGKWTALCAYLLGCIREDLRRAREAELRPVA